MKWASFTIPGLTLSQVRFQDPHTFSRSLPPQLRTALEKVIMPGLPSLSPARGLRLHLAADSLWVRDLDLGRQAGILVLEGQVWITLEGDMQDHVLTIGQQQLFHGPGRLLIQALETSAVVQIL